MQQSGAGAVAIQLHLYFYLPDSSIPVSQASRKFNYACDLFALRCAEIDFWNLWKYFMSFVLAFYVCTYIYPNIKCTHNWRECVHVASSLTLSFAATFLISNVNLCSRQLARFVEIWRGGEAGTSSRPIYTGFGQDGNFWRGHQICTFMYVPTSQQIKRNSNILGKRIWIPFQLNALKVFWGCRDLYL